MRGRRVGLSALPIAQCAVAAGVAWFVAGDLVGHATPFFAPIAAVISLGVSLGSRLRRVVELVVGVSLGVLVGDLLISQIGSGAWQVALVVLLAMGLAVFADGATLLVAPAGSSAVLVATLLPPGQTGGLDRCIDALIGGLVGVLVAMVLPADPVGPVRRKARALLDELAAVLCRTADALRDRDADAAAAALESARASQSLIDEPSTSTIPRCDGWPPLIRPSIVDRIFSGAPPVRRATGMSRDGVVAAVLQGGYPIAVGLTDAARGRWFANLAALVVERVSDDVTTVRNTAVLSRLLRLSAANTAQTRNAAELGREVGLGRDQAAAYLRLLELE